MNLSSKKQKKSNKKLQELEAQIMIYHLQEGDKYMKEEHTHDWQYFEPKEVVINHQKLNWKVKRLCKDCLIVEEFYLNK